MVDLAVVAHLPDLEGFGAGAQESVVVDLQRLERVLWLGLGAAEIDALRAGVVDVQVVDAHVAHHGVAVVVGLGDDAGELRARDLEVLELELGRAASDREARKSVLAEGVVDQDAVGALAVGVGAVRVTRKRGVAELRVLVVAPREHPTAATVDREHVVRGAAADPDLAAEIRDHERALGIALR